MSLEEEYNDYKRRQVRELLDNDRKQRKVQKTEQVNGLLDQMFVLKEPTNKKKINMSDMPDDLGIF